MGQMTVQQAFDLALEHHRAGRLREAEHFYRQILAHHPRHTDAMHHLGVIAYQSGQNDVAVDLIRRAIALAPNLPEPYSNLGNALTSNGQIDEALAAYRQAIALWPGYAAAHCNLGNALRIKGQLDDAIAAYRHAVILSPGYAEAHSNLGNALREKGQAQEAIAACRAAIAHHPSFPQAHNNLGNALRDNKQLDEAIAAYRQAIALKPDYPEAFSNLGSALKDAREFDQAVGACRQAIALRPSYAEAYCNLGNALRAKGRLDEAIAAYQHAIALNPSFAEAHSNLGNAFNNAGQFDQAIAAYRRAIELNNQQSDFHSNLGIALKDSGRIDEAIASYRCALASNMNFPEAYSNLASALIDKGQLDDAVAACETAVSLDPNLAEAHNNLGNALKDQRQLDGALVAYRHSTSLDPHNVTADSNLIFAVQFHPAYDARAIAQEQRRWNRLHAQPLATFIRPHANDRDPDRRLRIGYISPDFRSHVVGRNIMPLLARHDHRQFEITCYSQTLLPDAMTSQFQRAADAWRNIVGVSDEQAAEQIRQDRIDILVDLALHTSNNRLLLFARKPAPVQVTFAGYPGSTGLTAIDYRLSDPYLDPPGMDESIYSEKTIRLPGSFWCYDPLDCGDVPVSPLPAMQTGKITFGCLNNFCKINNAILELWARVMLQVEGSRLILLTKPGSHRQRTLDFLLQHGIDPERIEFEPNHPRPEYLKLYNRIDIGLDSFPYNGHTTSLDSFWMGVPVVTLVGQTAVSRAGWCQLSNLGLAELAGHHPDQFVEAAVNLAGDLPRLAHMRSTLRKRMEQSPLMDGPRFARNIEAAYRQMWRRWCDGVPAPAGQ
jgi:predicted O-linked N-acetylglucosamine transferase (SPINDLY family)